MRRELTTGLILIAVGVLFLLSNLGYIQLNWRDWWPVILIIAGVGMLFDKN